MTPLLRYFVNFIEFVHVELPDEGGQMLVPEEEGQHLILQLFGVLYQDLSPIISPGNEVLVLIFLNQLTITSRM